MKPSLVILRGIPSSGKSTWSKDWVNTNSDHNSRVCRDDIRFATFGRYSGLSREQEELVSKIEQASVEALLRAGKNVAVDAMHVRPMYVKAWRKFVHNLGIEVDFQIKEFYIDLETAIERDAAREKSVGEDVLRTIFTKFTRKGQFLPVEDWTPDVGMVSGPSYLPNTDMPRAWLIDLDGTVAKNISRGYHDYHRVSEDAPRQHVIDIVRALFEAGDEIVFLSGRPDSCFDDTREWLIKHFDWIGEKTPLLMRKAGDYRKDFIIKNEIFDEHIRHQYNVVGAIDDRPQVLRLWDSLGIPALDAAPLSGEF